MKIKQYNYKKIVKKQGDYVKKILKNKSFELTTLGFTLAELLGVLIILAVIALISIASITNTMKESKEKLYNQQINNIIFGAKNWASSHAFEMPENDGESITLTLEQLKQAGFVEEDVTNPKTNELFSNDLQVKITKVDNNYKYEVIE